MVELMWAVKAHRHAETYQKVFARLCSQFYVFATQLSRWRR